MNGNLNDPSLYHLLEVFGKEKLLAQIEKVFEKFS
jgi:hypothetical protein